MAIRFAYALARPHGYADRLWKRIRERWYYYPQKYVAQLRCASVLSLLLLRLPLLALCLFQLQVILIGDPGRRIGASLARIEWALGRGQKTTYGRSSKKPTVGRSTDLPWVVKTTYRRSFLGGARRRCLDGLESGVKTELAFPRNRASL